MSRPLLILGAGERAGRCLLGPAGRLCPGGRRSIRRPRFERAMCGRASAGLSAAGWPLSLAATRHALDVHGCPGKLSGTGRRDLAAPAAVGSPGQRAAASAGSMAGGRCRLRRGTQRFRDSPLHPATCRGRAVGCPSRGLPAAEGGSASWATRPLETSRGPVPGTAITSSGLTARPAGPSTWPRQVGHDCSASPASWSALPGPGPPASSTAGRWDRCVWPARVSNSSDGWAIAWRPLSDWWVCSASTRWYATRRCGRSR